MADASYRDAAFSDQPLRLVAAGADDLAVVSALAQDAVGQTGEVSWMPRRRRLAILLNRFRWEDRAAAERDGRPYERVRAALLFDSVLAVRARGIDPSDRQRPLSLLRIDWRPEGDGAPGADAAEESQAGDVVFHGTADADTDAAGQTEAGSDGTVADGAETDGAETDGAETADTPVGGRIVLALAGGGEVALDVECIDVCLVDLTRPWEARARRAPDHPPD